MYLWHPQTIPELPGPLLTALHRDVCRLRSAPWSKVKGKNGWVHMLPWSALVWYHRKVLAEMTRRGWSPSMAWMDEGHRGLSKRVPDMVLSQADESSGRELAAMFKKHNPKTQADDSSRLTSWRANHGHA